MSIAEDATAEAFVIAVERWRSDGVPPNPGGWLTTTATRKAIDRLRRESIRDAKQQAAMTFPAEPEPTGPVEDDRLRLMFMCCHPVLPIDARVALTLRLVGGLTMPEIANAFLVSEAAMGQRLTRAKAKVKAANVPFEFPTAADLHERLDGVLAVIYLVFNEGYLASTGGDALRVGLSDEAIRLGRLLHGLLPEEGEVAGLLALMILTDARRPARVSATGELVTLAEQDRGLWDRELIAEGEQLVTGRTGGRYLLLAAINAVHTSAASVEDTRWDQIVALYDRLLQVDPSPIVRLNRAIAVAEVADPAVALALVDDLADQLDGYHPFHVTRAGLLHRLGRDAESRASYDVALGLISNPAERAFLTRRRDELD